MDDPYVARYRIKHPHHNTHHVVGRDFLIGRFERNSGLGKIVVIDDRRVSVSGGIAPTLLILILKIMLKACFKCHTIFVELHFRRSLFFVILKEPSKVLQLNRGCMVRQKKNFFFRNTLTVKF